MKYLHYLIGALVICNSCRENAKDISVNSDNEETTTPITNKYDEEKTIKVRNSKIGDYSNEFNFFDFDCAIYYQNLLIQINIWPENAKIDNFLQFYPYNVNDKSKNTESDGVFLFAEYSYVNEVQDTLRFTQASYFNNESQILIPAYLKDSNMVELDTIYQIYLPFRDIDINCGDLNFDTILFDIGRYGAWEIID